MMIRLMPQLTPIGAAVAAGGTPLGARPRSTRGSASNASRRVFDARTRPSVHELLQWAVDKELAERRQRWESVIHVRAITAPHWPAGECPGSVADAGGAQSASARQS